MAGCVKVPFWLLTAAYGLFLALVPSLIGGLLVLHRGKAELQAMAFDLHQQQITTVVTLMKNEFVQVENYLNLRREVLKTKRDFESFSETIFQTDIGLMRNDIPWGGVATEFAHPSKNITLEKATSLGKITMMAMDPNPTIQYTRSGEGGNWYIYPVLENNTLGPLIFFMPPYDCCSWSLAYPVGTFVWLKPYIWENQDRGMKRTTIQLRCLQVAETLVIHHIWMIGEIWANYLRDAMPDDRRIMMMMTKTGDLIATTEGENINRVNQTCCFVNGLESNSSKVQKVTDIMLDGNKQIMVEKVQRKFEVGGEKYYLQSAPLAHGKVPDMMVDWIVIAVTPEKVLLSNLENHGHVAFGILGAIWGGAAILSLLVGIFLVRPVHKISKVLSQVAYMELDDVNALPKSSYVKDINVIIASTRILVQNLSEYKRFLPSTLFIVDAVGNEAEGMSNGGGSNKNGADSSVPGASSTAVNTNKATRRRNSKTSSHNKSSHSSHSSHHAIQTTVQQLGLINRQATVMVIYLPCTERGVNATQQSSATNSSIDTLLDIISKSGGTLHQVWYGGLLVSYNTAAIKGSHEAAACEDGMHFINNMRHLAHVLGDVDEPNAAEQQRNNRPHNEVGAPVPNVSTPTSSGIGKGQQQFVNTNSGNGNNDICIGIARGPVSFGNVGNNKFRSFALMGRTVSQASALAMHANRLGVAILVNDSVMSYGSSRIVYSAAECVQWAGEPKPKLVYEPINCKAEYNQEWMYELAQQTTDEEPLEEFKRALTSALNQPTTATDVLNKWCIDLKAPPSVRMAAQRAITRLKNHTSLAVQL